MAAIAIAVSFFIIILAVAVSAGFRNVIRDGVAAMTGDVRIQPYVSGTGEDPVSMPAHLPSAEKLLALPGVVGIEPVAVRAGIVKNGDIIHGVVVKGVVETPGRAGGDGSARHRHKILPRRLRTGGIPLPVSASAGREALHHYHIAAKMVKTGHDGVRKRIHQGK